jgi:hypothetical protein
MDVVPVEYLMFFLIALPSGSLICDPDKNGKVRREICYFTQKSMSKWPPPPTWYVTVIWNNESVSMNGREKMDVEYLIIDVQVLEEAFFF